MLGTAGTANEEVDLKEGYQAMKLVDVTERSAFSEPGAKVGEAMRRVREPVKPTCSFDDFDFQELINDHKLWYGEHLLDSMDFTRFDRNLMSEAVGRTPILITISRLLGAWRLRHLFVSG